MPASPKAACNSSLAPLTTQLSGDSGVEAQSQRLYDLLTCPDLPARSYGSNRVQGAALSDFLTSFGGISAQGDLCHQLAVYQWDLTGGED